MPSSAWSLSLRRKVLLGYALAAIMLLGLATFAMISTHKFVQASRNLSRAQSVVETVEALTRRVRVAESSMRGFVATGDENFLTDYPRAVTKLDESFKTLGKLLKTQNGVTITPDELKQACEEKVKSMEEGIAIRRTQGRDAAVAWLMNGTDTGAMERVRVLAIRYAEIERNIQLSNERTTENLGTLTVNMIIAALLFAFLIVGAAAWTIFRELGTRLQIERALASERNLLSALINALPDYVYVKDRERRFIMNNAAHLKLLGVEAQSDVLGKRSEDYFPMEQVQPYLDGDREILKGGKASYNVLHSWKSSDGESVYFSTTKVPLRDPEGEIRGLVGITSDVTKFKRAEEALRIYAAHIERQNRDLQDFATVASHDLQEPLRKIIAFSDRLLTKCQEALDEDGRYYLERSMDAAQRMQTLIQDLLKLSRVGNREHSFTTVNLNTVLTDVISNLENQIERTKATLHIGKLPELDANPSLLRLLFQNLLSNAMKFQKPDVPPVITVEGFVEAYHGPEMMGARQGDPVCRITVADNGIGFDQKFAEKIFTVFQRLHTRDKYEGTGIGLAVVRRIVDRHGGLVEACSTDNGGATFHVTLPVKHPKNILA